MKKIKVIQKIIGAAVIIAAIIFLTGSSAYGQGVVCQLDPVTKKCVGTCPPLYNGNGTVAGTPVCQKVGQKCVCSHLDIVTLTCKLEGKVCKGRCDPLYRSPADAQNQRNPIQGKCQAVQQGAVKVCACRYTL